MPWLQGLTLILQYGVLPLMAYVTWVLRDIRDQLRTMNGRMIDMERWRQDHDVRDDERFERLHDDLTFKFRFGSPRND